MNKEIIWNIVNSLLAAGLVVLGALSSGIIGWQSFYVALIAGGVVAFTQFKDYWDKEQSEYCSPSTSKMFSFIKL